jgi:hypothetical protein
MPHQLNWFFRVYCETVLTTAQQGCKKRQNISGKGAKAAKFGQVKRYFSLRSWRLGAINSPSLRPQRLHGNPYES